jgi:hypothetical protein
MKRLITGLLVLAGATAWCEDLKVKPVSLVTCCVLGVEFTYAPDGPPAPALMQWSDDDSKSWNWLFDGKTLTAGAVDTIGIEEGSGKLVLKGQSPSQSFLSSGKNALVLRHGEKLADFLAIHRIRAPYNKNERAVSAVIQDRLDQDGCVRLKNNQLLLLFELGTDDPQNPVYDFQDVVMILEFDDLTSLTLVPRITPDSKGL